MGNINLVQRYDEITRRRWSCLAAHPDPDTFLEEISKKDIAIMSDLSLGRETANIKTTLRNDAKNIAYLHTLTIEILRV